MSGEGRFAAWRGRLPVLVVVVGCVAGLVAALTGAANPVSAVQFLLPGTGSTTRPCSPSSMSTGPPPTSTRGPACRVVKGTRSSRVT